MQYLSRSILMIRPSKFGFNEESYLTNSFQNRSDLTSEELQSRALNEFDHFVKQLQDVQINVVVINDVIESTTPDSIFPNNWFSTHLDKRMFLYPMAVANRRDERRPEIIDILKNTNSYSIVDLSNSESEPNPQFLEGTGSLIFDHVNKIVYAAISPRTHENLVDKIASLLNFRSVKFKSYGKEGELIYHTNVMLTMGDQFAVLGLETVDSNDQQKVVDSLIASKKEIIYMTNDQIFNDFAGNMIQLQNASGENVMVMSNKAFESLSQEQLHQFNKFNKHIIRARIPTIEHIGGGSARCMIAELF